MSALLDRQQALLAALFAWPPATEPLARHVQLPWTRGLQAYQTNGHALAQRALGAAYPVLAQLVGGESFAAMARAFWHAHPPQRGDLAQWGDALPEFVRASAQLAQEPYLADVASVEWARHCSAGAPDREPDRSSFALLVESDPAGLTLDLAPGCAVLRSTWPVASIFAAHQDGGPGFEQVGARMRDRVAEDVVVWRAGLRPQVRQALPGEAALLDALLCGMPVLGAVDAAPELDFQAWLGPAFECGLLLGARLLGPGAAGAGPDPIGAFSTPL